VRSLLVRALFLVDLFANEVFQRASGEGGGRRRVYDGRRGDRLLCRGGGFLGNATALRRSRRRAVGIVSTTLRRSRRRAVFFRNGLLGRRGACSRDGTRFRCREANGRLCVRARVRGGRGHPCRGKVRYAKKRRSRCGDRCGSARDRGNGPHGPLCNRSCGRRVNARGFVCRQTRSNRRTERRGREPGDEYTELTDAVGARRLRGRRGHGRDCRRVLPDVRSRHGEACRQRRRHAARSREGRRAHTARSKYGGVCATTRYCTEIVAVHGPYLSEEALCHTEGRGCTKKKRYPTRKERC
jgi:hypothetical protein